MLYEPRTHIDFSLWGFCTFLSSLIHSSRRKQKKKKVEGWKNRDNVAIDSHYFVTFTCGIFSHQIHSMYENVTIWLIIYLNGREIHYKQRLKIKIVTFYNVNRYKKKTTTCMRGRNINFSSINDWILEKMH